MGLVDQITLAIYTLVFTALSAITVLVALGWSEPMRLLSGILTSPDGRWATGAFGALFFLLGLRLLASLFRRREAGGALVRQAELGEVQIALGAVESFVDRVGRQVDGVRDLRARVMAGSEGIRVHIRAKVGDNVHVPQLSEELQNTVRQQVQRVIGVDVEQISTMIDAIDGESRRRRVD